MGEERAALEMLDAFVSVGARRFDLTLTDAGSCKFAFRSGRTLDQLRPALLEILQAAAERHHNVIVRPRSSGPALVQLDDLDEQAAGRLRPVSFLTLRTSAANYQMLAGRGRCQCRLRAAAEERYRGRPGSVRG